MIMLARRFSPIIATVLMGLAGTALAQTRQGATPDKVGQRLEAGQAPQTAPLARVRNRLATRLDTRLRMRIDENYNPEADQLHTLEAAPDDGSHGSMNGSGR